MKTADLYDQYGNDLQVAEPLFLNYGGVRMFRGKIATVRVYEDNVLVRAALAEPGEGRVLVVDGGGSLRCALVGDQLAILAHTNGWSGIVVYGCIRDTSEIAHLAIGVKALQANPRKSVKRGEGKRDVPVAFAGVMFTPGHYLYADEDGIVVAAHTLG